ncbi:hypothetical protein CLV92_102222 [Kineococcus xinjiangensis]|uniref:Thioredoxin domain-containing protein n=1 Tax=Kineococcus xinjiangensis TaxID=512762 RepID=A0A2S6IV53_9ACTN|nr:hypothetical protein [Kineococcus xinjiangensis]PPK98069.1 hypothetical protein CLV92_102222 [Kineococcus xinjiangensis]
MTVLVTVLLVGLTVAVALLGVLVVGLLRSHAEILRSLHELGAGREDTAPRAAGPVDVPFGVRPGVLEPAGVTGAGAVDVSGETPDGDSVQFSVTAGPDTLLAFLSSGCLTCHGIWERFRDRTPLGLPAGTRLVVVTQGTERESATAVEKLAAPGLAVVMSTAVWEAYEVPGSPYFVLVDGTAGRVAGEGSATSWEQVERLVTEATGDRARDIAAHRHGHGEDTGDGAHREARADRELLAAGIAPGHPSLELTAEEVAELPRAQG